ncbi:putative leucine-rich repeat receptor-like protein kinase [Quercus suber]|uniref:non-specific serine/threonine protein kinase n=1 Tax=Quercus suber TaxID=58331 RepID=A0AAW0IYC8_QUESU
MAHIFDFGTAKLLKLDSSNWTSLVGTMGYMAPSKFTIPQSHPTMKQVSQDLSTWKPRLAKPLCMITLGEIVMSKCERGRGEESEAVVVEEDDDEEGSDVHVCVRGNEEAEPEVARRVDHDV